MHCAKPDVVDLVYEIAAVVSAEMPAGLECFGHVFSRAILRNIGMPPLPDDLGKVLKVTHSDFMEGLRSSYMIRLLTNALGGKTIPMAKSRASTARLADLRDLPASERFKKLVTIKRNDITNADRLAGTSSFESTWCSMVIDLLEEGDFSIHEVTAVSGQTKASTTGKTTDSGKPTTTPNPTESESGKNNDPKDGEPGHDQNQGRLVAHIDLMAISDSMGGRSVTVDTKAASDAANKRLVHSVDDLARIRLAVQGEILNQVRQGLH